MALMRLREIPVSINKSLNIAEYEWEYLPSVLPTTN
jgi:hypothetical protein